MDLDVLNYSTYTQHNRRPRRTAENPLVGGVILFILLWFSAFSLCITACHGSTGVDVSTNTSVTPTHSSQPALTITSTVVASMIAPSTESTTLPCTQQPGTVTRSQIADPTLSRYFPFRIYLPACYVDESGDSYPTLYMLHGLAKDDSQWDTLGIDEFADLLISTGSAPPFLIIMPFHATGIDLETALVDVLVPYIDEHYRTRTDPRFRSIGGLSRGGGLALRIGLQNPQLFHSIGLHSPANVSSCTYITRWVDQIPEGVQMKLWIDIGDRDPLLESTQLLITWLEELDLDPSISINTGFHDNNYWSQNLESYLSWYVELWVTGE